MRLPGGNFKDENIFLGDTPVEALTVKHIQFDFGHVEPTAVLGSVMELQTFGNPSSLHPRAGRPRQPHGNFTGASHELEGRQLYHNAFVTNHLIDDDTVKPIMASGRARWKAENEGNNTLKNHGYHLAHNFGHDKQHLSSVLVTLDLLAFLCHTVLNLISFLYQRLRRELGTRRTFLGDIRTLTRYFYFPGWQALLDFMANGLAVDLSQRF